MNVKGTLSFELLKILNKVITLFYSPKEKQEITTDYVSAMPGNCGIGCVAMLVHGKASVTSLEEKYKKEGFYTEKSGWIHRGLQKILKDFNLDSSRHRFQNILQIMNFIQTGKPVIVSLQVPDVTVLGDTLYAYKDHQRKSVGHLCLLIGSTQLGFILHDPRNIGIHSSNVVVPYNKFAEIFSGNCIVVENYN